MLYSAISLFAILTSMFSSNTNWELPKTWTKDFTITLSHSGSMDGSSTHVTFTYDSCKYVGNSGMHAPLVNQFALTANDREQILKKLRELKVNKIHSDMSLAPVNDGWSSLMCFGLHCIEGGTSSKMSDSDKAQFLSAYDYLETFAVKDVKH